MAGVSRLQYSTEIRLIRVMCSGRVDLEFMLRAFANGVDGVFVGGCKLNECNYVTHGNYDALANTLICKKILKHLGILPERLSINFMSGGDGIILAERVDAFTKKIEELGQLGKTEGIGEKELKLRLQAARSLVPYLKLVERERLRAPVRSREEYEKFYDSEEVDILFKELIADKLAVSQIMLLLEEKPLSTRDISAALGLNPSDVAKHMNRSSRQGLVKFDVESKCYARA